MNSSLSKDYAYENAFARHLSHFLLRWCQQDQRELLDHSIRALVQHNQDGHVCLRENSLLARLGQQQLDVKQLQIGLLSSGIVSDGKADQPLVVEHQRLYLQRHWLDECEIAEGILKRLSEQQKGISEQAQRRLEALFADQTIQPDWQKRAVEKASQQAFSVITGGPGTGKTTTVIRLLLVLLTEQKDIHIALAAPTGKAAARLLESVQTTAQKMLQNGQISSEELTALPQQASTIHRLLGRFNHSGPTQANKRLPYDCLILDEASMIDQALMAKIMRAIKPETRLILLGDKHQLASVAAGSVLADITGSGSQASENAPLAIHINHLKKSWRFDAKSGIGQLAAAINAGDVNQAGHCFGSGTYHDLQFMDQQGAIPEHGIIDWFVSYYQPVLQQKNVLDALQLFAKFRLLCAHKKGLWGAEGISQRITQRLYSERQLKEQQWLPGMPILITRNDQETGLYNGDIGLIWYENKQPLACFEEQGELRKISVYQLPRWESAWALTVHKSQGSEFDEVMVLLPPEESPVCTRELLYTAITRARKKLILASSEKMLENSIMRQVQRDSGLMERLGW